MAPRAGKEDQTAELIARWQSGDTAALPLLLHAIYGDLQRIAGSCLRGRGGDSLEPAALIHEAFLRLAGDRSPPVIRDKGHLLAFIAKVMQRIVVDHIRERSSAKRGGGVPDLPLDDQLGAGERNIEQVLDIGTALARLAQAHPEAAMVLELRYYGGYELQEIAELTGVSLTTVTRRQRAGQAWLARQMRPRHSSDILRKSGA